MDPFGQDIVCLANMLLIAMQMRNYHFSAGTELHTIALRIKIRRESETNTSRAREIGY